jgi:hypothetical protein
VASKAAEIAISIVAQGSIVVSGKNIPWVEYSDGSVALTFPNPKEFDKGGTGAHGWRQIGEPIANGKAKALTRRITFGYTVSPSRD